MSQEKPNLFDLEQFGLEFKGRTADLIRADHELYWREGAWPVGKEKKLLEQKFEKLYKETISLLVEACISSDRNPEVFKKVTELMNLWISPDNDVPVFPDKGAGVLKDFTDELLRRVASPEEADSREVIKEVLQQS